MHYVYLLESIGHTRQRYTGMTSDLKVRVRRHNSGQSKHTAKYRPWRLVGCVAFEDRVKAVAFER